MIRLENQNRKIRGKQLLTAAALVVLCVNLITLLLGATGLRESLGWLPYGFHAVESGSMEPDISRGDLILIKEVPFEELVIGDDVTFITTEGFVTHRIVDIQQRRLITQGLANAMPDPLPVGAERYCGKVIARIPGLGQPVKALTGAPAAVTVLCLLILMLTVGQPLLKRYLEQEERGTPVDLRSRGLVCAAAISLLLTMPAMTEAKYLTRLNRYELAVAQPMYFSSNYLSTYQADDISLTGNIYNIQGWTGEDYILNLDIRNHENSLLFNEPEMTLVYGIAIEKLEGCNENYTISLSPSSESVTEVQDFPYPEAWNGYSNKHAYSIDGGSAQKHAFHIVVSKKPGYTPQANDVVRFAIHAHSSREETYLKELKGTFHLQKAQSNSFLNPPDVANEGTMIRLSVTTNLITGSSTEGAELVAFRWDPQKVYLNEYERTAFNAINDENGHYDPEEGLLYIRLQAYSKVELEFFKRSAFVADKDTFTIMVVENINQIPAAPNTQPSDPPPATEPPQTQPTETEPQTTVPETTEGGSE